MSTYLVLTLYVALSYSAVAKIQTNYGVPQSTDSGCNILSEYLVSVGYPSHHVPLHTIKGKFFVSSVHQASHEFNTVIKRCR